MDDKDEIKTNIAMLMKATNFAAIKHKNQLRKDDRTPYINHPIGCIGVANILTSEGKICDPIVLQAALLHDTVEDTDTTFDEIEEHFGPTVRKIVSEVTDDKTLPYGVRKQLQIERASKCSYEAKLVKLADKLYNLRDLLQCIPNGWDEKRANDYFVWASEVVKGLKGTNEYLEQELKKIFDVKRIEF